MRLLRVQFETASDSILTILLRLVVSAGFCLLASATANNQI